MRPDVSARRMTPRQIRALEVIIARSKDATVFGKKVIIWALRKTDGLTRPVALSLSDVHWGGRLVEEMQNSAHDMVSSQRTTHLPTMLDLMGTNMCLMHHGGMFVGKSEYNNKAPGRTIWFSPYYFDNDAELLVASRDEIEFVDLTPYRV